MQVKGTQKINDWHLIIFHEEEFMSQFAGGGKVFVDVGAHVGAWSIKLSNFFEKVIAFEPNPLAFDALIENVSLNNVTNIHCENMALGDTEGMTKLTIYAHPSHSTLKTHHPMESHCGEKKGEIDVPTTKLDNYELETIDLIKIDVEGAEVEVIKGALNTIRKFRPKMIIEIHSPENEQIIKDLLPDFTFTTKSNGIQPYLISE